MATTFPVQNETAHDGEFIIAEANGDRSREEGLMDAGLSAAVAAGTIVKLVAGVWSPLLAADTASAQPIGIAFGYVDSTGASDVPCTVVVRDATVAELQLGYNDLTGQPAHDTAASLLSATAIAELLATNNIVVRSGTERTVVVL